MALAGGIWPLRALALIFKLVYSATETMVYSATEAKVYSATEAMVYSFTEAMVYSLTEAMVYSAAEAMVYAVTEAMVYSSTEAMIYSFTEAMVYSATEASRSHGSSDTVLTHLRRGVWSGSTLLADKNFYQKYNEKVHHSHLMQEMDSVEKSTRQMWVYLTMTVLLVLLRSHQSSITIEMDYELPHVKMVLSAWAKSGGLATVFILPTQNIGHIMRKPAYVMMQPVKTHTSLLSYKSKQELEFRIQQL